MIAAAILLLVVSYSLYHYHAAVQQQVYDLQATVKQQVNDLQATRFTIQQHNHDLQAILQQQNEDIQTTKFTTQQQKDDLQETKHYYDSMTFELTDYIKKMDNNVYYYILHQSILTTMDTT